MVLKTANWNRYPGECEYQGLSVRHRAAKGDNLEKAYALYSLDAYPFAESIPEEKEQPGT